MVNIQITYHAVDISPKQTNHEHFQQLSTAQAPHIRVTGTGCEGVCTIETVTSGAINST